MSTYAFILGRVYTLSLAEILSYFSSNDWQFSLLSLSPEAAVFSLEASPTQVAALQHILGGTIKIIQIIDSVKKKSNDFPDFALKNYITSTKLYSYFPKLTAGKVMVGVSAYSLDERTKLDNQAHRMGMHLKSLLKTGGTKSRFLLPDTGSQSLSSVTLKHNRLPETGLDLNFLCSPTIVMIGKTLSIQDFEDYGRRDYSRPVRDLHRGMMPPKLAQMMINLSGVKPGDTIYDPFCGLGTIMQEALLFGCQAVGSDIDPKAIQGLDKNLLWLANRYKIPKVRFTSGVTDATKSHEFVQKILAQRFSPKVSAIISEGSLGPVYTSPPTKSEQNHNFENLADLYHQTFKSFSAFLEKHSKTVLTLPAYQLGRQRYSPIPNLDFILELGYNLVQIIPETLLKSKEFLQVTQRGTIIYDRKDQLVAREVAVFEKM